MRPRYWIWLVVFITFLMCILVPSLRGQELTPEQMQQRVIERAREIERREAEEKVLKELAEQDTPAMRKARKEIERENKEEQKFQKRAARAQLNANVQNCTRGTVHIDQKVGNDWGLKRSSLYQNVTVIIVNNSEQPIDVSSTRHSGTLVGNLCSGGSATLTFSARPNDAMMVQMFLTATSTSVTDRKTDTFQVTLQGPQPYGNFYNYRQDSAMPWNVNLH
jgi:hypothetical protein